MRSLYLDLNLKKYPVLLTSEKFVATSGDIVLGKLASCIGQQSEEHSNFGKEAEKNGAEADANIWREKG